MSYRPVLHTFATFLLVATMSTFLFACDDNPRGSTDGPIDTLAVDTAAGDAGAEAMPPETRNNLLVIHCVKDDNGDHVRMDFFPDPVRVKQGGILRVAALNTEKANVDLTSVRGWIKEGPTFGIPDFTAPGAKMKTIPFRSSTSSDSLPHAGDILITPADVCEVQEAGVGGQPPVVGPNMIIEP